MTDRKPTRKIVGISLSVEMARAFKEEAARREVSLKKLFSEMWELYLQKGKKS